MYIFTFVLKDLNVSDGRRPFQIHFSSLSRHDCVFPRSNAAETSKNKLLL